MKNFIQISLGFLNNIIICVETYILFITSIIISHFFPNDLSRYKDEFSYSIFQFNQAKNNIVFFQYFKDFLDKIIVDIGCGEGGKTVYYSYSNAKKIIGIDINFEKVRKAERFLSSLNNNNKVYFICGDIINTNILKEETVDFVISDDGFEHFQDVRRVIGAANKILKENGMFIISFSPYLNSKGHHMYNWIRFPWAHALFSKQAILYASHKMVRIVSLRHNRDLYGLYEKDKVQFINFINGITIRQFERFLCLSDNWKLINLTYCSRSRLSRKIKNSFLREIDSSVFCVLEKVAGCKIIEKDIRDIKSYL